MEKKIKEIASLTDIEMKVLFEKESILFLHELKIYADDIYYNTDKSSGLDDWKYDILKDTLKRRDPNYVVPVGARIREHENRVKLQFWLGSMDKLKPEDDKDIAQWVDNNKATEYIIEDKLDGISCLLSMKNNKIKLYTRGDGIIGGDISYLSQYFSSIPNTKETLNVRGELIMKDKIFKKNYSKQYANQRNMVAGRVGAKTMREGLQDIEFVAYEIIGNGVLDKPSEQLDYLDKLGFKTVSRKITKKIEVDHLMETLVSSKDLSEYDIDGLIVQPNVPYERVTGGNPQYAFAFKMRLTGNLLESKVIGVNWNVSKWGNLKPRVEIEPVHLGGVTITWATGFNAKFIVEKSIGPGAIIEITRSGDVIPYIVSIVKKASVPDLPEIPYQWNETGVDIYTDEYGDEMCVKLIASFFAELGIKHVGEKNVKKLYESGYDTLIKIIAASKEDFMEVPGFGKRLAERTWDNIHGGLDNLSLSLVLGASGVFGFGLGSKKIKTLIDSFPDILEVSKMMSTECLIDRIIRVEGFSVKTARKIVENIDNAEKFILAMKNFATFKEIILIGNNMTGMKVVLSGFRNKKLEEDIVARGGKVTTSVSGNTSVLVLASTAGKPSAKTTKALELGIEVLNMEEFMIKYII